MDPRKGKSAAGDGKNLKHARAAPADRRVLNPVSRTPATSGSTHDATRADVSFRQPGEPASHQRATSSSGITLNTATGFPFQNPGQLSSHQRAASSSAVMISRGTQTDPVEIRSIIASPTGQDTASFPNYSASPTGRGVFPDFPTASPLASGTEVIDLGEGNDDDDENSDAGTIDPGEGDHGHTVVVDLGDEAEETSDDAENTGIVDLGDDDEEKTQSAAPAPSSDQPTAPQGLAPATTQAQSSTPATTQGQGAWKVLDILDAGSPVIRDIPPALFAYHKNKLKDVKGPKAPWRAAWMREPKPRCFYRHLTPSGATGSRGEMRVLQAERACYNCEKYGEPCIVHKAGQRVALPLRDEIRDVTAGWKNLRYYVRTG
ncbi:uncharacterized protein K452DRAFT_322562 [Aplosporella prunicola CBS 121167]|uniref:Uncharacterized protein n=1 Tax=Aplosporella prunicola CBS 121167 TaxID=1176127 RepID=A0A6A6AW86_9PEZI|nr:uncharacterized protein K452DRAFT_322562 [Aplosporella prunicola CBS 121167]KAF2136199.1 hypothetical protein K452DRAFT_322562 [Aplosporella prunicola CBS 121167]